LTESGVENPKSVYTASWFPVGSIRGWTIEEEYLHFLLDCMEDDIGLQRNKTGLL
jgi:hypothetical protein